MTFTYAPYPPVPSRAAAAEAKTAAAGGGRSRVVPAAAPAPAAAVAPAGLSLDERFNLVRSVGEECQKDDELRKLLENKPDFRLYDGFEPSGRMHIAQGVFKAMNVNKCTKAGGTFVFWVADWFALMNDKMGGDLAKIKVVGDYLIEVWKAAGMDMDRVVFKWAADEINAHAEAYWTKALDVARTSTLARIAKCGQIMGRKDPTKLTAAQILYPIMQCTDVFFLRANICQLGVDQRKVNMLARDYCDAAGMKLKPIILSHHMLYGLKAGQSKMSKSDPDSAIFMEDTAADVERKINNAFCPRTPEEAAEALKAIDDNGPAEESMSLVDDELKNPCLDYIKHIVFSAPGATFNAGGTTYTDYDTVHDAFVSESLGKAELKRGLIDAVNKLVEPVRAHFSSDPRARDLLAKVKQYKKETAGKPPSTVVRRMACRPHGEGVSVSAVVMPIPTQPTVTFEDLFACLTNLRAAVVAGDPVVLWVPDWTAFVLNRLQGNVKAIDAVQTVFLEALRLSEPGLMDRVAVVKQSEAILADPDGYWFSVINVGRANTVADIGAVLDTKPSAFGDEAKAEAGGVLATLMHVSDLLSLSPRRVYGSEDQAALHNFAKAYFATDACKAGGISTFENVTTARPQMLLKPHLTNDAAAALDPDQHLTMSDLENDVKRKIKKAFSEPGKADPCPPLVLAAQIIAAAPQLGSFSVPLKEGEPLVYAGAGAEAAMRADYASGKLHPGDLKPAVTALTNAFMQPFREKAKAIKDVKKAETTLKNFKKQAGKKKSGKK